MIIILLLNADNEDDSWHFPSLTTMLVSPGVRGIDYDGVIGRVLASARFQRVCFRARDFTTGRQAAGTILLMAKRNRDRHPRSDNETGITSDSRRYCAFISHTSRKVKI